MKFKGFSLIEVLIALFITGAIVLVIANIPHVITLIAGSQSEAKVREVAAKRIEDIRLSGFDSLANGTIPITDPKLDSLNSASGSVITEDCPVELCTNDENAKKVTVTINWRENNASKVFSVTTLVAQGGLK